MSHTAAAREIRTKRIRLAVTLLIVVLIVAWAGVWYWRAHRTGVTFSAVFSSSTALYPGNDVRILGVPVGRIDSITPQGTQVVVAMHLDPGVSATADTYAVIVSPNLVSDRYIQLTGTYTSGPKLTSGTQIPLARTKTPVELDQLYTSLQTLTTALGPDGANSDGALSRLLKTGAANLAGNGQQINNTIRDASKALDTLSDSSGNIFATIDQLSKFTGMLQQNNAGLQQVNTSLASVSQTLSDDRQTFSEAIQELGSALGKVQTFVQDNRAALTSNVAALSRVTKVLAYEQVSISKALSSAPLLVQNFLNAYDPTHNVLRGRADLNELTLWASQAQNAASGLTQSGTGTDSLPPTLLPSAAGGS